MFVTVDLTPQSRAPVVQVPTEAVIQTGKRTVVIVAEGAADGKQRFAPLDVEIGVEANGMTEIRKGLKPGTKVVVSGQFLLDSEASLKATTTRLDDAPGRAGAGK
jgi:Cu(I)/Ag(I) efflux system membrane fusion protein